MHRVERERLIRTAPGASASPLGSAVKCGACLGLLALLALIGSGIHDDDAAPGAPGPGRAVALPHAAVGATAHRKLVFEDRRARFDGQRPESSAVKPARDGPTQPSVP